MAEYCLVVWCGLDAGYQQNTFSKAGVFFSNALILCGVGWLSVVQQINRLFTNTLDGLIKSSQLG